MLVGASLFVEVARRSCSVVDRLLWGFLPTVFREWESRRVLGSTWLATGEVATLVLYGQDVGATAVLFLAWGDPAAEIVGSRWGRPGQRKTMAGSAGCLVACLLAGSVGLGLGMLHPYTVLTGAIVATAVERWSPPPDDNVWMPVLSGMSMAILQRWIGG
jgi:dolichol kinase